MVVPVSKLVVPTVRRGWVLSLCEAAGEAGGSFRSSRRPSREGMVFGPSEDPARSAAEAARRARGKVRRYCAANRLNRLGTLTYRGEGCHDTDQLVTDVGVFFRRLRRELGGKPFAYVWVRSGTSPVTVSTSTSRSAGSSNIPRSRRRGAWVRSDQVAR